MMATNDLHFFTPAAWPVDETARQARVDEIDYEAAAADPRLGEIVARTAQLFGSGSAVISIVTRHRQEWIVRVGVEQTGTTRAISFCGHVVADPDRVLTLADTTLDPRFVGNPLVTRNGVRFYAGAPLMHKGMAIGALCTIDGKAHTTDAAVEQELATLADEAGEILARYTRPPTGGTPDDAVTPDPA